MFPLRNRKVFVFPGLFSGSRRGSGKACKTCTGNRHFGLTWQERARWMPMAATETIKNRKFGSSVFSRPPGQISASSRRSGGGKIILLQRYRSGETVLPWGKGCSPPGVDNPEFLHFVLGRNGADYLINELEIKCDRSRPALSTLEI